jgi:hypothetical protein
MSETDLVNKMLDDFVLHVQRHFKAFVLSHTCHVLGSNIVSMMQDDTQVTAIVGLNVAIEPVAISELRQFKVVYPSFIIDVFHGKLVQLWQDVLDRIFAHYVDLHVTGQRVFSELRVRRVTIDFRRPATMTDQARESLCRDFSFDRFANRQKLIASLRDGASETGEEASIILQHIQIRNTIQHHDGVLRESFFHELGLTELVLLDESGSDLVLRVGDSVVISVVELDRFRRALLMVAQRWKKI